MAMQATKIDDVLLASKNYHHLLSERLVLNSINCNDDRKCMLLDYLAQKESEISSILERIRSATMGKTGNTWLYLYTDRHWIIQSDPSSISFHKMPVEEAQESISTIHDEMVDLFQHIHERAESNLVKENMEDLVKLYRTYNKKINYEAGRINEI